MTRLLFVDDEPMVLQGLRRMLRSKRREWDMHFNESAKATSLERIAATRSLEGSSSPSAADSRASDCGSAGKLSSPTTASRIASEPNGRQESMV